MAARRSGRLQGRAASNLGLTPNRGRRAIRRPGSITGTLRTRASGSSGSSGSSSSARSSRAGAVLSLDTTSRGTSISESSLGLPQLFQRRPTEITADPRLGDFAEPEIGLRNIVEGANNQMAIPPELRNILPLFKTALVSAGGVRGQYANMTEEEANRVKASSLGKAMGSYIYDQAERKARRDQLVKMGFMQDPDYEHIMARMTGMLGPLHKRLIANKFYGTETRHRDIGGVRKAPIDGRPEYGSKSRLFGQYVVPIDASPMKYLDPRNELKRKMKITRKKKEISFFLIFY